MSEIYTIKRINVWKNGKGAFVIFEERPETFYFNGQKNLIVGDKVEITSSNINCGDIKDSKRIDTINVVKTSQKSIPFNSPIAEAQRSTGAKLNAPVGPALDEIEKDYQSGKIGSLRAQELRSKEADDFLIHQLLAKQAEEILNTKAALDKILNRIDSIEKKITILQNKTGVSFL